MTKVYHRKSKRDSLAYTSHCGNDVPVCPYCNYSHNASEIYEETGSERHECESCGRVFMLESYIQQYFNTQRLDCEERDEDHDYEIASQKKKDSDKFWAYKKCAKCERFETLKCNEETGELIK